MNWNGPIVLRSPMYLRSLKTLLMSHPNRIIHNSLLMLFVLNALPHDVPAPLSCTKATVNMQNDYINWHKYHYGGLNVTKNWQITLNYDSHFLLMPLSLIAHNSQMSLMPEASSSLFMSQFTDAAVRDAIARVSLIVIIVIFMMCTFVVRILLNLNSF
jgi:hypothetical protein